MAELISDHTHLPAPHLKHWASQVLQVFDVAPAHADATASALVRTSLRGIDTHGIVRLPSYVERILEGQIRVQAQPRIEERHGMLHCHGDQALGQPVLALALEACLEKAANQALVGCHVEACGHLAALGVLLLPAVEQGCLALLCQRTPPIMALPGATLAALGNNPLAFAAPVAGQPPLVFDMALSAVSRGAIMAAAREGGQRIPLDWALDASGQPTADPQAALGGAMQPMAGYKGLGLAMVVECLAGALGDACSPRAAAAPASGSSADASAFLLVINPALAAPSRAVFDVHMATWITQLLQAQGAQARYPGLRQHHCELERSAAGIPLTPALLAELQALAQRSGVELAT